MKVSIWDKQDITWVILSGVKSIIEITPFNIQIDGVSYPSIRYVINFIDSDIGGF